MIKISKACIAPSVVDTLTEVFNDYLGMGQYVREFEAQLSEYFGGNMQVIAVNTGTSALHLAVEALGIGPGDEVLVPSLTYVASCQAVSAARAKPVLCNVDERGFIDLSDAHKRISSSTKAIMPVHYASDSSMMVHVYDFAREHGLRVIEDAAHSFGSVQDGQPVGHSGDVLCFSFDGIKNITCGEGGAIVTSDTQVADYARDARLLGVAKDTEKRFNHQRSWDFDVSIQGYRYHMSNINAAIGLSQLKQLNAFKSKRQDLVACYLDQLQAVTGIKLLPLDYGNMMSHIFVIRVMDGQRDALRDYLREHDIETGIHYKPNHLLTRYSTDYALPMTEQLYDEIVTLPLHCHLETQHIKMVCQHICQFLESCP